MAKMAFQTRGWLIMQQVPEKLRNLTLSRCHRGKNITSGKAYSTYPTNILPVLYDVLELFMGQDSEI
jgi:hypothetical protein